MTKERQPPYDKRVLILSDFGGSWKFGKRVSTSSEGEKYEFDSTAECKNPVAWMEEPETIKKASPVKADDIDLIF